MSKTLSDDDFKLVEKILERGLRGSNSDKERAISIALSVLRYGHGILSTDESLWLDD